MYRVCGAGSATAYSNCTLCCHVSVVNSRTSKCYASLHFGSRTSLAIRTSVSASSSSAALISRRWLVTGRGGSLPPPPPLPPPPGSVRRGGLGSPGLPPPPPLTSAHLGPAHGAGTTHSPAAMLRSPQDVLATFIPYIPTYYVSVPCVASILPEELRESFIGRGRLAHFLRRYPFLFDVPAVQTGAGHVRLHRDVSHPQRGEADGKFMMTDVGETTTYIAKPEFITSTESLDSAQRNVYVVRPVPPPSVQVHLEERVPVVERLRALVPDDFIAIETLEESIPEDVLFHPYFDCQGGLLSIAGKLPDEFQVAEGYIRRRPRHLAPLALDEYTLATSPLPEVAAMLQREVCASDIPHWVNITSLYEQLTREQKHQLKQQFKSFAGFLRAHGRALAVSTDMLQVSMWICKNPPPLHKGLPAAASAAQPLSLEAGQAEESATVTNAKGTAIAERAAPVCSTGEAASARPVTYTREEILNAWYDRFPSHKTLNLREAMALLPLEMRTSGLPGKIAPWLATYPHYFTVDFMEEEDPTKVLIRRASDRQPIDLAIALYAHMPDGQTDYDAATVLPKVEPSLRRVMEELGLEQIGEILPQWLRVTKRRDNKNSSAGGSGGLMLRRLQEPSALLAELERQQAEKRKRNKKSALLKAKGQGSGVTDAVDAEDLANLPEQAESVQ